MLVKKKDKKSKKKNTKRKVIKKTVKKEIKQAVDKIPGMIFEQIEFKSPEKKQLTPAQPTFSQPQYYDANEKRKHSLMWFGIITIAIIIFSMWVWNTRSFMKDLGLRNQQKTGLWDQAKEEWAEIKKKETNTESELEGIIKEETNTDDIKATVKQTLLNIIASSTKKTTTTTTSALG